VPSSKGDSPKLKKAPVKRRKKADSLPLVNPSETNSTNDMEVEIGSNAPSIPKSTLKKKTTKLSKTAAGEKPPNSANSSILSQAIQSPQSMLELLRTTSAT
jgi:flagellar biosynthesis/type III secretory pathway chaperone